VLRGPAARGALLPPPCDTTAAVAADVYFSNFLVRPFIFRKSKKNIYIKKILKPLTTEPNRAEAVPKTLRWARVAAERVDVKAGCV
jgi:hypothetical protein